MRLSVPALAMAVIAAAAPPASAQETRIATPSHLPPVADLDQMDWLVGSWEGAGIGDNRAMESWLPATEGTMVGTFVQTTDTGAIMFTEHMYLMEENGSLVLRLKHFNADLTGWEAQDEMLTFRLVKIEPCAAYFQALTLRCDGPDGLVAAVRMSSDGDEINELLFRFTRAGMAPSLASSCSAAPTTVDLNECYAGLLAQADERRGQYLAAAIETESDRPELAAMLRQSDEAFTAYRDAECGAVLQDWIEGSIRGVMVLTCRINMTDRRTHTIWQNWLTHMDSTPPLLPEPEPSL